MILPTVCLRSLFRIYKLLHFLSNSTLADSQRLIRISRRWARRQRLRQILLANKDFSDLNKVCSLFDDKIWRKSKFFLLVKMFKPKMLMYKWNLAQRRRDHLVPIRIKRCEFTNPRFERKRSILYMRKKRSKMITMIDQKWFSCFSRLDRILPYSKYKRTELRRELHYIP